MKRLRWVVLLPVCLLPWLVATVKADALEDLESVTVLHHDYRLGHMLDLTANDHDGVPTDILWVGGGVQGIPGTGKITVTSSAAIEFGAGEQFSIVVYGEFTSQTSSEDIVKKESGGVDYNWYLTATQVVLFTGATSGSITTDIKGSRCLGINAEDGTAGELFVDGITRGPFSAAHTFSSSSGDLTIGNLAGGTETLRSPLQALVMFNRKLTGVEHAQVCSALASRKYPIRSYRSRPGVYGPEVVVDWDMEKTGFTDWSVGSGGTLSKEAGRVYFGNRVLRVDKAAASVEAYQDVLTIGSTYRVMTGVRGDATARPSIILGSGGPELSGTTSTSWQLLDFVGTATSNRLYMYRNVAGGNYCEFDNVSVREVLYPEIQFQTYWGAHTTLNKTSGYLAKDTFRIDSGTWKVGVETVAGETIKTLECVVDGEVFLNSELFRGDINLDGNDTTWQMYLWKEDASVVNVWFVSTGTVSPTNGWYLTLDSVERLIVTKDIGLTIPRSESDPGYVPVGSWNKLAITREAVSDEFTTYMNDTLAEGDKGSSTSNPFTDSTNKQSYGMRFAFDAGDKMILGDRFGRYGFTKTRGAQVP